MLKPLDAIGVVFRGLILQHVLYNNMCGVVWGGGEMAKIKRYNLTAIAVRSTLSLAQIAGTRAEPQQIVAQRLLSCLQYPVLI